jgi:hypothetical protein
VKTVGSHTRAFHPNEVVSVDELQVGKKIRCHYAADKKEFGTFSGLGLQTGTFIDAEDTLIPMGDFYFICVKKEEHEVLLIADRVIQTYISADTILSVVQESQAGKEVTFPQSDATFYVDLPTGGNTCYDKNNDWDILIIDSLKYPTLFSELEWFLQGPAATWTKDKPIRAADFQSLQVIRGVSKYRDNRIGNTSDFYTYGTSANQNEGTGFRPKLRIVLHER